MSLSEKFTNGVKFGDIDQCWPWCGADNTWGYGLITWNRQRRFVAHRISWILFNNQPIPSGQYVLHKCDNKRCVNPHHLFLGSIKDNAVDCARKLRLPKRRLTVEEVRTIRASYPYISTRGLAMIFRTKKSNTHAIISGKNWGWLPEIDECVNARARMRRQHYQGG